MTKTKVLRWGRIVLPQEEDKKKPSVWDRVVEIRVDEDEVSRMFAIKKASKVAGAGGGAGGQGDPQGEGGERSSKPVRVLPEKRFNAISILATQLPPGQALVDIITRFDREKLAAAAVHQLYNALLTDEEVQSIQEVMGPDVVLDKAEQFGMMLAEIPCVSQRLHCWTFMNEFDERVGDIGPALTTVQKACKELRDSAVLRQFLGVVLAMGNVLNAGNKSLGQADGFSLETFRIIGDMHDASNKVSVLDVCLRYCKGSLDQELPHVSQASGVDLKYVQGCFAKLNTDFQQVSADAQVLLAQLPATDPAAALVGKFVADKGAELSNLRCDLQDTAKQFQDTVEWFTLDPAKTAQYTTDSFFGIFKGLVQAFQRRAKAAASASSRRMTYGMKVGTGDDPMADIIAKIKAGQAQKMTLDNVGNK